MTSLVGTGQLGGGGRPAGRGELHPGAAGSERLFAEEAEVAPERLAQGKTPAWASPVFSFEVESGDGGKLGP